jgi:hypothetical protein
LWNYSFNYFFRVAEQGNYLMGISKNPSGKAFRPANTGVPQGGMRMLDGRSNAASGVFRGALM